MKRFVSSISLVLSLVFAPVLMGAAAEVATGKPVTNHDLAYQTWRLITELATTGKRFPAQERAALVATIHNQLAADDGALLKQQLDPKDYALRQTLAEGVYSVTSPDESMRGTVSFASLLVIQACENRAFTQSILNSLNNTRLTKVLRTAADSNGTLPYEHALFIAGPQSYARGCCSSKRIISKTAAVLKFLDSCGCNARPELESNLRYGDYVTNGRDILRQKGCKARCKRTCQLMPVETACAAAGAAVVASNPAYFLPQAVLEAPAALAEGATLALQIPMAVVIGGATYVYNCLPTLSDAGFNRVLLVITNMDKAKGLLSGLKARMCPRRKPADDAAATRLDSIKVD